jgi:hypothetical protein
LASSWLIVLAVALWASRAVGRPRRVDLVGCKACEGLVERRGKNLGGQVAKDGEELDQDEAKPVGELIAIHARGALMELSALKSAVFGPEGRYGRVPLRRGVEHAVYDRREREVSESLTRTVPQGRESTFEYAN